MEEEDDRLLKIGAVCKRVGLSPSSVARLASAGKFPQRLPIGFARSAWSLVEIRSWMQTQVDQSRQTVPGTRTVKPDDRFIGAKEISSVVPFTPQHLRVLEKEGRFPARISLGARVVWLESEVREWIANKLKGGAGSGGP